MTNPFSGLENIGQSYLQGVELAQQRQLREEAIAQRREEARIRERYYQDLIGERQAQREALRRQRMDQFASVFGRNLKLTPEGDVDIPASALARDRAIQEEQLAAAEGELGALYGTQAPLSPEVIASPAYQTGKLRGLARRLADERAENVAMIRRGWIPVDQEQDRELPDEVRSQIEDISAPDIFSGEVPVAAAPTRAGAPMGGGQRVSFGGRQWSAPTPTPKRAEKGGTVKFTGPGGEKYSIDLSPEAARSQLAAQLATPEKEPGMFDDIEAAEKELKRLASRGKDVEVNVYEDEQGNIKVRKDQFGYFGESRGLTAKEAKNQLDRLRTLRREAAGETSEEAPKNRAEAAARARRVTPVGVLRNLPALPQRVPVATPTNAIPAVVNSMAPAGPSAEDLRSLDPEELAQALAEARTQGIDPGQLGLQLRQALQEAGVPTAAGTNSMPLGMIPGSFDQIMRLPRGRIPVEL